MILWKNNRKSSRAEHSRTGWGAIKQRKYFRRQNLKPKENPNSCCVLDIPGRQCFERKLVDYWLSFPSPMFWVGGWHRIEERVSQKQQPTNPAYCAFKKNKKPFKPLNRKKLWTRYRHVITWWSWHCNRVSKQMPMYTSGRLRKIIFYLASAE